MSDFPVNINATSKENVSNKSTNVNTDQASDTRYPSVKAVFDWATNLLSNKVDKVTGKGLSTEDYTTTEKSKLSGIQAGAEVNVNADWNATSGDAQILNKPTIPDASDFVEKSYFTSHSILAKQSGGSDPVAVSIGNNEILGRKSGGGSNIEGLSVSEAKAILNYTASDVGAPSGSGTSTGTNTGDETQSSILAKLGWNSIQDLTPSSVVTGTTTETIVKSIPLWTLTDGSILRVFNLKLTKKAVASVTVRLYINNVDNNLSGAIQIAATGSTWANTGRYIDVLRTFNIVSGNIEGLNSAAGTITDTVNNTSQHSSQSLPSGQLYLIVTVQNGAVGEETTFRSICLKNL
jgi:hypothetical protein